MITSPALPEKAVLGSCEIRAVLGQGGCGISYLAYDRALEREVVIKEHFPMGLCHRVPGSAEIQATDSENYKRSLGTFCREARILAGLSHPNVVKVFDIFEGSGTAYLVMEYVDGETLRDWMTKNAGNADTVQRVLEKLLTTLHYLHGNSVLHRDLKPANIIIREDGQPIIIDFGAALLGTTNHTLTPVGSPGYAAPEQFSPRGRVGAWSDLYALAQSFLHLIPREQKKRYPKRFLKALHKAGSHEAEDRYISASLWQEAIRKPQIRVPLIPITFALLVGGAIGILGWSALQQQRTDSPAPSAAPTTSANPTARSSTLQARQKEIINRYQEKLDALNAQIKPGMDAANHLRQVKELQQQKTQELRQLEQTPEIISLKDGTVIYDSSGKQAGNGDELKQKIEKVWEKYQLALLVYQSKAEDNKVPEQQQKEFIEKLTQRMEDELRELVRN